MANLRMLHYLQTVRWSIGGVVRAVLDLSAVMASRGHEVELITADPTDVPPAWMRGEAGKPRVKIIDPPGLGGRIGRTSRAVFEQSIATADVVHLHGPWTLANAQIGRWAKRAGKPYVLTVHGVLDDWCMAQGHLKKRAYLFLSARRLLNEAAAVHVTAAAELEQARKWFSSERAVVLPYLFDLSELRDLPGPELARQTFEPLRAAGPHVLFLSRLHMKKGAELLLDAAAILRRRGVVLRVAIAGDGEREYEESLRKRTHNLGLYDVVSFLGLVKGDLKLSVYQAADLFVLPTSQENFGLVFPESMACGTPVITTRGVDIWQELQDGGATIVDATPESLADAMARLLSDPAARQELARRGRQWVWETLDTTRMASAYEELYRRL